MNCDKCGTPIIPGENSCRFCGSFSISKRVPKPEIIGLELENKKCEVIDFEMGEDDLIIGSEEEEKPVIIDEIIEPKEEIINKPVIEESIPDVVESIVKEPVIDENISFNLDGSEVVKEEVKEPEEVQDSVSITDSVIEEPPTAKIPVEKVKQVLDETEVVDMKPSINLDATIKMDKIEEPKEEIKEEVKETKILEEPKEEKKSSNWPLILILILLLIGSLIGNYFFLTELTEKNATTVTNNPTNVEVVYNNYSLNVLSTWTINNSDESLIMSDSSNTWAVSLRTIKDFDYESIKSNSSEFTEKLGSLNYLIKSDYTKTVNDKELYVFKGSYYDYSVYVIAMEIDEDAMLIADLKFDGEVEEDVLNNVLESISKMQKYSNNTLNNDNFDFKDITSVFEVEEEKDEKGNK